MTLSELRKIIKSEIEEASQTGTGSSFFPDSSEAYALPYAFKRKKRKKKNINEISYRDYKKSTDATPRQKIGNSIKEVERKLNEIEKIVKFNKKLKEEMGIGSGRYWKSTNATLARLSEKIKSIGNEILQLGN